MYISLGSNPANDGDTIQVWAGDCPVGSFYINWNFGGVNNPDSYYCSNTGSTQKSVTITATVTDVNHNPIAGGTASTTLYINPTPVVGMSINLTSYLIQKGQTIGVSISNLISGASWATSYFSCPNNFITSNHNGSETITGVNGGGTNLTGTVTFYAYKADGVTFLGSCSASFTVTPIKATGITVSPYNRTFTYAGETQYLVKTVSYADTYDQSVTWSSTNTSVATVSDGTVTAVANGSCSIRVTTNDGTNLTATCNVVVDIPILVSSITVNPTSLSFSASGQQATVAITSILPLNASNKGTVWSTSNPSVATISNGIVTVTKSSYGSASCTISCTAVDGSGATASCSVNVNIPDPTIYVNGVYLNITSIQLAIGGQVTLTATISPSNATNKGVTWTTGNSSVAQVSGGVVTAIGVGICNIVVTTSDGGYQALCTVTVGGIRPSNWSWIYSKISNGSIYNTTVENGTIVMYILPATEWTSFTSRINEFRTYKSLSQYGFTSVSSGSSCTPSIINQASIAIESMVSGCPTASLGSVYASTFNDLRDKLNSIT